MTGECLNNLFNKDDNKVSIGLKNVNERLKNKYGDEYGLEIQSEIDKGTVATIIIPKH